MNNKWIKFSETYPPMGESILYYDSKRGRPIAMAFLTPNGLMSHGYYCNYPECDWISYEDCGCYLITDSSDYWMKLPEKPEITKKDTDETNK